MSIFTSFVTQSLSVPGDPEQTITIRKLAPKHLKEAQRASQMQSIADLREMGGAAFLSELKTLTDEKDEAGEADTAVADPLLRFDPVLLMQAGVTDWSYDRERDTEAFEDLDDDTADWLARAILRLAKPSLFAAYDEDAAQKETPAPVPGA